MNIKKKGFHYKLTLSYITLAIIVTVFVSATTYYKFKNVYVQEVDNSNKQILSFIVDQYEREIVNPIDRIFSELMISSDKSILINRYLNQSESNLVDVHYINKMLGEYVVLQGGMIEAIHIYAEKSQTMVSSKYGYKSITDDKFIVPDPDNKYPIWITKPYKSPVVGENGHFITKVYATGGKDQENQGYIAFDIKEERLYQLININEDGERYILSEKGEVLSHKDKSILGLAIEEIDESIKDFESLKEFNDEVYMTSNNDTVISVVKSKPTNWSFVTKTPMKNFYPLRQNIVYDTIMIAVIFILIGVVFSLGLSYYISKPIKKAIQSIGSTLGDDQKFTGTDLEKVVSAICVRFYSLEKFLKSNKEIIKNNFILYLYFDRRLNDAEFMSKKSYIGFGEQYKEYATILLKLEISSEVTLETKQILNYKLVNDIESIKCEAQLLATEVEDNTIAIVCNMNNIEVVIEELKELLTYPKYKIFISESVDNDVQLGNKFEQVKEMVQYKFFYPNYYIFKYSEFKYIMVSPNRVEIDEKAVMNYIKKDEIEMLTTYIHQVLSRILSDKVNFDNGQACLLKLISIVASVAKESNIKLHKINTIVDVQNISEFKYHMDDIISEYFEIIGDRSNKKRSDVIERIEGYVQENYMTDISLTLISEYIDLNPTYISRFFKEQTGINLTDYIRIVKLEQAERLLRESNYSIGEIASLTGYNTTHYFIKLFKEKYDMTPSVYRKQLKK